MGKLYHIDFFEGKEESLQGCRYSSCLNKRHPSGCRAAQINLLCNFCGVDGIDGDIVWGEIAFHLAGYELLQFVGIENGVKVKNTLI